MKITLEPTPLRSKQLDNQVFSYEKLLLLVDGESFHGSFGRFFQTALHEFVVELLSLDRSRRAPSGSLVLAFRSRNRLSRGWHCTRRRHRHDWEKSRRKSRYSTFLRRLVSTWGPSWKEKTLLCTWRLVFWSKLEYKHGQQQNNITQTETYLFLWCRHLVV